MCVMKRKLKQWLSTIPPTSTKRTNTSHIYSLNAKKGTTTYEVGNLGPGLGQPQEYGGVKQVNGIITLPS